MEPLLYAESCVCVKCPICIILFNSLNCLVKCVLFPFLELKKLIISHICDQWRMIYCSLGSCGACLAFYYKMSQARKVWVLCADMEQAGGDGVSLSQGLVMG